MERAFASIDGVMSAPESSESWFSSTSKPFKVEETKLEQESIHDAYGANEQSQTKTKTKTKTKTETKEPASSWTFADIAHQGMLFGEGIASGSVGSVINGAKQLYDHVAGKEYRPTELFSNQNEVDSSWAGQIGSMIGTSADFIALTVAAGPLAGAVGLSGYTGLAASAGLVGVIDGGLLTATQDDDFLKGRLISAGLGGITSVAGLGSGACVSALTSGLKSSFAAATVRLGGSMMSGALIGGGTVESSSLLTKGTSASLDELVSSAAFGAAGGVMGAIGPRGEKIGDNRQTHAANMAEIPEIPAQVKNTSSQYDIKFVPIDSGWTLNEVAKHTIRAQREIEYSPENIHELTAAGNWKDFNDWGIEKKTVPVNVYQFPDVKAEIVVPFDYAEILDRLRQLRLSSASSAAPENEEFMAKYGKRLLPEEIAQAIKQLPQPDLVGSVQLLHDPSPTDIIWSHDEKEKLKAQGKLADDLTWVCFAAADEEGNLRFYPHSTNDPEELQTTMAHEWSHLLERNDAFKAFPQAARAERNGFFVNDYARTNDQENWAVHLGERFLNSDGKAFSELPEKAPIRTLVMAKAVRNMLEERASTPSPRHEEFFNRVHAAETVATQKMQEELRIDLGNGDTSSLDEKLLFLHIAATEAKSPELFSKVLDPIEDDIKPYLVARNGTGNFTATQTLMTWLALKLKEGYSEDRMKSFVETWRTNESLNKAVWFNILPEQSQTALLDELEEKPCLGDYYTLKNIINDAQGPMKAHAQSVFERAQSIFAQDALTLKREGQRVPSVYRNWLAISR